MTILGDLVWILIVTYRKSFIIGYYIKDIISTLKILYTIMGGI